MDMEKLIKDNLKMIYKIASYFYNVDKEDLVQAGALGLVKAYRKYNENSGAKFSTYAHDYIYGEMYLLASKKIIKVNRENLKLYKLVEKTRYVEAQNLGYVPGNLEVSKILNIDVKLIDYACSSASELISTDAESEFTRNIYETYADESANISDNKILLMDGLETLSEEEKIILNERYFNDETQANIARKLSMTQVMVSRLEKKGISKMREYMRV